LLGQLSTKGIINVKFGEATDTKDKMRLQKFHFFYAVFVSFIDLKIEARRAKRKKI
jgi:hypothetical protein